MNKMTTNNNVIFILWENSRLIPIKIETLLEGKVVEQNRAEYKEGWNPSEITYCICAFANDYANVNGGYIVIGVKEENGMPILPPKGVPKDQIDTIQKEIFQYCNQIEPRYIPQIEVVDYPNEDISLIYLKCSAGDSGPYRAPKDVYRKSDKSMYYWIRLASLTTIAKQGEISELFEKFNSVPFDDRINRSAKIDIIRRAHLEDFLRDSKSSLIEEINTRSIADLLVSLEVANETDTGIELRNIAVLMFAENPEKIIPGAQIDLVWVKTEDAEAGDIFFEKTFTGPIWKQVRDVLDYIKTHIILSKTIKIQDQAIAERFDNYPYRAIEEALVNAVFHKSYRDDSPVKVRIYLDRIMVINFPGPDRYISMENFAQGKARARKYRNRRIGEFFKEIKLSEKQGTGITKILRELKKNGFPEPLFESDEDRVFLETTIFIRDGFDDISEMPDKLYDREKERMDMVIQYLKENGQLTSYQANKLLDTKFNIQD